MLINCQPVRYDVTAEGTAASGELAVHGDIGVRRHRWIRELKPEPIVDLDPARGRVRIELATRSGSERAVKAILAARSKPSLAMIDDYWLRAGRVVNEDRDASVHDGVVLVVPAAVRL